MKTPALVSKNFIRNAVVIIAGLACAVLFLSGALASSQQAIKMQTRAPVAPVRPVTDDLYGIKVTDRYRYMENLKDSEVAEWFRKEDVYTRSVLDRIPGRDALLADIQKYDQSALATVSSVTRLPGDVYFYEKALAQENVAKLYVRHRLDGQEKLVFDPEKFEEKGGPQWTIDYYTPSFDGRYVAVGVSPGGSEASVLHVVDVATAAETGEAIARTRFAELAWRADNHSFFYDRLRTVTDKTKNRVYLHVVGTDESQDRAVFGYGLSPNVSVGEADFSHITTDPSSPYAVGFLFHGVLDEISAYATPVDSLGKDNAAWRKIISVRDGVGHSSGNGFAIHGDDLYLRTHQDAPRYKVVRISLSHPDFAHAETILPQSQAVVQDIVAAKDALYVQELDGSFDRLLRIPYDAAPEQVTLPLAGSVVGVSASTQSPGVTFAMLSRTRSQAIYRYDPDTRAVIDTQLQPVGPFDAPGDLESVELKVPSYDGTMVPLSVVYKRGLKLDGSNPVLLTAYGAYGLTPGLFFTPVDLAWYERGGVYAFAHVRGGGEYGDEWHKAGMQLTKPNTWRDFIACAEYLINHKYTSPQRLAISGASAGGIAVGRFLTERPDLVAAVLDSFGVSNPLRFEFSPSGSSQTAEFGSVKSQAGFEDLYTMDSYQHVRDGVRYPAVLLTTGWNDPRVDPWQPGKMAARLQSATTSERPILLHVHYNGGHGLGGSTKEQFEIGMADARSFLLWQLGVKGFQPETGEK